MNQKRNLFKRALCSNTKLVSISTTKSRVDPKNFNLHLLLISPSAYTA